MRIALRAGHSWRNTVFRITTINEPKSTLLLKLEGKLLEPWLGELTSACSAAADGAAIRLDLSCLTYVDPASVLTLRDLLRSGVTVAGTSPFVAALLGLEDR